ncbi:hypothetical protein [Genomoviridae sp.]|nr:hypothetical protein [Genomoviridae sp.]
MSSSHTLKAAILMQPTFSHVSRLLEENASLDERIMLMGVLISMFSSILEGRNNHDDPIFLMSVVVTRTLCHLEVVQTAVTTMQSRMEISLEEHSSGRAEVEFLRLRISGALSSMRKVERSFWTSFANWIQRHLFYGIGNCWNTPTSTSPSELNPTWVPMGSNLSLEWYLSWLDGKESLLAMIQ